MAVIRPFRGVHYDPAIVPELGKAVTQPYDRISPQLRQRYLQQDSHSFAQLILADVDPHSEHDGNPYLQSAAIYQRWMQEGVLAQDDTPSLYVYRQTFDLPDGRVLTRRAFMAALQLTAFDDGTVLPHERTLSAPKADRLNLMRATHVNHEPVFVLYADPENRVNALLDRAIAGRLPAMDAREAVESSVRQQMWVVADEDVIERVRAEMAPKRRLVIADGHHRYETALLYRDEVRRDDPNAPCDAPYDFVLAALVSTDDPGLAILPTHRLVHSFHTLAASDLEEAAREYFVVRPLQDRERLNAAISTAGDAETAIGFVARDRQSVWTLKGARIMDALAPERARAWRQLDVVILHHLVLERLMGLTSESIVRQENLRYLREVEPGFRAIEDGEADFLFVLNPTRIDQVRACAEAGEQMPQKSTDFYPKMVSGLVLRDLRGDA